MKEFCLYCNYKSVFLSNLFFVFNKMHFVSKRKYFIPHTYGSDYSFIPFKFILKLTERKKFKELMNLK